MVARAIRHSGSAGRFGPPPKSPAFLAIPLGHDDGNSKEATELSVPAASLLEHLLQRFGDVAKNERAREVIASEVNNYQRLRRKTVTEQDIAGLESRIRSVLAGGGPTRSTKVAQKRAAAEADDWARLYAFQDQLGEIKDKDQRQRSAEQQAAVTAFLGKQIEEQQNSHKRDSAQELAYAAQQQAQLVKWQQQEDQKSAFRKDAMCKLKATVQDQLADRQAQKRMEATLKLQEEQGEYALMAAELKAKMEAEAQATAQAKEDLRKLMLSNEANKDVKEKQRLAEQALDRKYAREYTQKLEQEDKARQAQVAKRSEFQNKQAAIAQALPESKRWIDPELIERNFKASAEAQERKEDERKRAAAQAKAVLQAGLAGQIAARQAEKQNRKACLVVEEAAHKADLKKEAALEEMEHAKAAAKREALRKQLEDQLNESLERKLHGQPAMTKTEREINADMLRRMYAAKA